jgi:hypothetical protein
MKVERGDVRMDKTLGVRHSTQLRTRYTVAEHNAIVAERPGPRGAKVRGTIEAIQREGRQDRPLKAALGERVSDVRFVERLVGDKRRSR